MKKCTSDISRWPYVSMTLVSIIYKINNASKLKHRHEGFLALEYLLLPIIHLAGDNIRQDELIKVGLFSKSTISRQLEELRKKDYLEVYPDENNGYFNCVRLKPKGTDFALKFLFSLESFEEMTKKRLDYQYDDFANDIGKMYSNLNSLRHLGIFNDERALLPIIEIGLMSTAIHSCISEYAATLSLDNAKFHILLTIAINGGKTTFKKVESYLQIKQSGIVKQVHKLCELGYLETVTDENDKRVKWIVFAKEHEELLQKIKSSVGSFEKTLLESTLEDHRTLLANLYAIEDLALELIAKYRIYSHRN